MPDISRWKPVNALFVLVRAITYASLFIGVVLVAVPARLLSRSGMEAPRIIGVAEGAGILVTAVGGLLALWCVIAFAVLGHGTPAPFDPPRRLVVGGPYRFVRNPMYLGAGMALSGAALYYRSAALAAYAAIFLLLTHAFVVWYEEPTLRATFGDQYERYCRRVHRWWPGRGAGAAPR
jgi:protein-S-isoprenylcysteine O-methyltransferase Ste14